MHRFCGLIFLIFCSLFSYAQRTISGTVVDENTGNPVPGCSVFITNTSIGTVTAGNGTFQIADIPAGRYELVISSVGYNTNVFEFTDAQLPLKLKVELKIKTKELKNVVVESYKEEGWDKWGKTFTENFIGVTPNAGKCVIRNVKTLHFRYYKKSNRLEVFADEPLIIENKALGYRITYQLEQFEVDFNTRISFFAGYALYTSHKEKRKWTEKRKEAYNGSMMHFLRSVYRNKVAEDGFEIRRMKKVPNKERERVSAIMKNRISVVKEQQKTFTLNSGDSAEYYNRIMRQPQLTEVYSSALLSADSLIFQQDGEYKYLYFPDYLAITYKKETEDPAYLSFFGENRKPYFQRSTLFLPNETGVWIAANGNYFDAHDLLSSAYFGWSDKIGDSLPLDYEPGEE